MTLKIWFIKNKTIVKIWIILVGATLLLTFLQIRNPTPQTINSKSIDTYIPEGFVLLPIELSNASVVQGLLQNKAVVDLYTADPIQSQAQKAADAVKIIRSPHNESHFAVLVPENEAHFLIQRFKPFYAVIQNPNKTGTKIQPLKKRKKRSIIIELEEPHSF